MGVSMVGPLVAPALWAVMALALALLLFLHGTMDVMQKQPGTS